VIELFCKYCGAKLKDENQNICEYCGNILPRNEEIKNKSQPTLVIKEENMSNEKIRKRRGCC
jgi:uncharacterized membrane protein YvbJ